MKKIITLIALLLYTLSYGQDPKKGLQSVTGYGYVFGPLGLPNNGVWELDPVISRGGAVQFHYPKNSYKIGLERQNIFGTTPVLGIYNKKLKLNVDARNYSKGGFMLSVSKTITIWNKSN